MRTLTVITAGLLIAVLLISTGSVQASQGAVPGQALEREGVIHGWAFDDPNKDGARGLGEVGLPGTVVCLVGYHRCSYTEYGEYEFDCCLPETIRSNCSNSRRVTIPLRPA